MKNIQSKFKCWHLIFLLLLPIGVQAENIEETIISVQSYRVRSNSKLEVFSKYGTIHINTWDKDSLIIKSTQYFKAGDKKQLDKLKNSVDLLITKTDFLVNVKTQYLNPGKDILQFIPIDLKSPTETSVDFEIWMPEKLNLTLEHRYGDVFMASLAGDAYIDVAHGQFKAGNMPGKLKLNTAYCNASVNYCKDALISTRFGELSIDSIGKIKLESRSSDIIIGKADDIEIDGKNDDVYIRSCNDLHVDGYFSKVNAENISGNVYTKTRYGNLNLNFKKDYEKNITLFSNYTDIELIFNDQNKLIPVSVLHQKSRFMYSNANTNLKEEKLSGKDVIYKSSGTIGKGRELSGGIDIEIFSGEIKLIVK